MRSTETYLPPQEKQLLRLMILERYRSKDPGFCLPPMPTEKQPQGLSTDNYHHYNLVLMHIKECLIEDFERIKLERCSNYSGLPKSKKRLTLKAYRNASTPEISISCNQLRDLFRDAVYLPNQGIFFADKVKEPIESPSLSEREENHSLSHPVKKSFLAGLYHYISLGRFSREDYLERYPNWTLSHPETILPLYYRLKGFLPERSYDGQVLSTAFLAAFHEQIEERLEAIDQPDQMAGELLFRVPELLRCFLNQPRQHTFPAPFLNGIERYVIAEESEKQAELQTLQTAITEARKELRQLKTDQQEAIEPSVHRDWVQLSWEEVTIFQDFLEKLIDNDPQKREIAARAAKLLAWTLKDAHEILAFRPLEQIDLLTFSQLLPQRKQQGLSFRYYELFDFRPNARVNVILALDVLENKFVVIKRLVSHLSKEKEARFNNEVKVSYRLNRERSTSIDRRSLDQRVVQPLEKGSSWLVLRFVAGGDMDFQFRPASMQKPDFHKIQDHIFNSENPFPNHENEKGWSRFRDFMAELADTLTLLDQTNLAHREIHPSNILLERGKDDRLHPVLCDLDRVICPKQEKLAQAQLIAGKSKFDAPERKETPSHPAQPGDHKADVYSLAAILAYQFMGRSYGRDHLLSRIKERGFSKPLLKLMEESLQPNPHQRISSEEFSAKLREIQRPLRKPTVKPKYVPYLVASLLILVVLTLFSWIGGEQPNALAEFYTIIDQAYVDDYFQDNDYLVLQPHPTDSFPYLLQGDVVIDSGNALHIGAGNKILCDSNSSLWIRPGATIEAKGTAEAPILFTDRLTPTDLDPNRPGSWGGIIIMGNAPVYDAYKGRFLELGDRPKEIEFRDYTNVGTKGQAGYGGTKDNDDSGTLRHVIIENGGLPLMYGREINGLTLAGVGSATQIEHVQIRNSGDDGVEIFGGNVNLRQIKVYNPRDDGIDISEGYFGTITECMVVIADSAGVFPNQHQESGKNILEIDGMPSYMDRWPRIQKIYGLNFSGIDTIPEFRISFNKAYSPQIGILDSIQPEVYQFGYDPISDIEGVLPVTDETFATMFPIGKVKFSLPPLIDSLFRVQKWEEHRFIDTLNIQW